MPQRIGSVLLAVLIGLASATAHGHGPQAHGKKSGPVIREQKDWGIAGDTGKRMRTVKLTMADTMRFVPDRIDVREGETLRIEVRNQGNMLHEFVIGTKPELDAHAALMVRFPGMEHDEPWMVHVPPGKTGTVIWTFNRPGEFDFACLIAGHYQAGMKGRINVAARAAKGD